jgi:hypothetical protein
VVTQVQVDLRKLPAPERSYVANVMGVTFVEDSVRLQFGQKKTSGELRSLLVVEVPIESVRPFRVTCETFAPELAAFLSRNGAQAAEMVRFENEPDHVVLLRSNMIAAGYAGRSAELQFFHLAPFSLHKARASNEELAIDPVVRVDLSTPQLHGMLRVLMEAELPEDWK